MNSAQFEAVCQPMVSIVLRSSQYDLQQQENYFFLKVVLDGESEEKY